MPAPASSTNDAAICVTAKSAQPPVRAGRDAHAAARHAESARRLGGRQARHERQQDRRRQREPDADPQQAGIDRQLERADGEARGVAREQGHHRPRQQDAEDRAGAAQQQALGQQRATQRGGARSERRANRQLAFASHRPRQDQVGDVRARDDEDEPGGGQEHEQHRPGRRGDLIAQLHGIDAEVAFLRIRLRVGLDHRGMDPAQFGPRGLDVRARAQAAEQLGHPVHAASHHRGREMVRAGDDVGDDLRFGRIGHRGLEHADDGGHAFVEAHGLADHRPVALERRGPEPMRQHRRAGGLRAVVGRAEQAAHCRPQAHDVEVRAVDDAGTHDARLAQADHRERGRGELAEGRQRRDPRAQVLDLRDREHHAVLPEALGALADVDQPVLVAIDERPQQDTPDDAENRGVGPDAERQGDDHRDDQSPGPGQRPEGIAKVGEEAHRPAVWIPLHVREVILAHC